MPRLPTGFDFGVTSTAAQVEGAAGDNGRTPSIWDVFAGVPGRIVDGSSPAVAVDHFHCWKTDLALLQALGVTSYRFTLSWSRLQPTGRGAADPRGVAFYDRLLDRLLDYCITPFVGLHQADMPLELMEDGGWLVRSTAEAFADYTALAAAALGDRVAAWSTVDEPLTELAYGYAVGIDAPGLTLLDGAFQAAHHQLLAHGLATAVLRSAVPGAVGIVNDHTAVRPAGRGAAARIAAGRYDAYHNRQFADPVLLGRYPPALLDMPGAATDVIADRDLALIGAPLDFYGVGFTHPVTVGAAPENARIPFTMEVAPGSARTAAGWPDEPGSVAEVLAMLTRRYPAMPPMVVIGGGAAFDDPGPDEPASGGTAGRAEPASPVPDDARSAWIDGVLGGIADAVAAGSVVTGYFHRSLLDSWEWTEGFTRTRGLVGVEPDTLERRPRASFQHYRRLIERHRGEAGKAQHR